MRPFGDRWKWQWGMRFRAEGHESALRSATEGGIYSKHANGTQWSTQVDTTQYSDNVRMLLRSTIATQSTESVVGESRQAPLTPQACLCANVHQTSGAEVLQRTRQGLLQFTLIACWKKSMRAPTTDAFGMGVGGRKRWHGRARFTKGLDCGVPHGLRVSVRRFARNRSLGSRLLLSRLIRGAEQVLTGSKPEW
jgi:hypothetical protein